MLCLCVGVQVSGSRAEVSGSRIAGIYQGEGSHSLIGYRLLSRVSRCRVEGVPGLGLGRGLRAEG